MTAPPPAPYAAELETAIGAARAAGALLVDAFGQPGRERRKGVHDVVTSWDDAAEDVIMAHIAEAHPTDQRLGEETGLATAAGSGLNGPPRTWIVDPLDGTVNFASGVPFWCVSIALAFDADVVLGVIGDPLRGEVPEAARGSGAWRVGDGSAIHVRRLARLADAVVDAAPGDPDDRMATERIRLLQPTIRATRTLGSIALSLAMLATGRLDGVLQVRGLDIVDVAAGGLIAAEAGARVTDARGGPWRLRPGLDRGGGVAAATAALHGRLLATSANGMPAA
jgi:myo-inositol-1(or 4)-monophosphatase